MTWNRGSVAVQGKALLGSSFDSELSHLLFNGAIAVLAVLLVLVYPRNPWVHPLLAISILHGIEHIYIFEQFLRTGVTNGPGLLGKGGAFGVIPLERLDLHNVYNGGEMILMASGFLHEAEEALGQTSDVGASETHRTFRSATGGPAD